MKPEPSTPPTKPKAADADSLKSLGLTLVDTTWRMVTPSVIAVGAGLYGDLQLGSKPWLTLLGVVLGLACSAVLIRQQLRGVK